MLVPVLTNIGVEVGDREKNYGTSTDNTGVSVEMFDHKVPPIKICS